LYCGPRAEGTFTIGQIEQVLEEAVKIGIIEWIYFEGGEPFLFYPLLEEGIRRAKAKGFKVGVVTNGFGSNSKEDSELYLKPLKKLGVDYLSISNDTYHYGEQDINPATVAVSVAESLSIETAPICIEPPRIIKDIEEGKGKPVVGGGAKFRGRAVEKLTENLPLTPPELLIECPDEDLESPSRVHLDPLGNVHICQGISMGNMWETPLSELVKKYRASEHPVCGPLIHGGPAELAKEWGIIPEQGYIDECHFCYLIRKATIDRFPEYLAPRQVYGLE
jgi:hypothetical protein